MFVDSELILLDYLTAILKPFYVVTKQLEGEIYTALVCQKGTF